MGDGEDVVDVGASGSTSSMGPTGAVEEDPILPPITDLELPARAPVPIGSGTVDGWGWTVGVSADGLCVGLVDRQGASVRCETGVGSASDDLDLAVRSPRPPAPPGLFLFGLIPPSAASVDVERFNGTETDGVILEVAPGVDARSRVYVGWIEGYPRPIVPRGYVHTVDAEGRYLDGAWIPRPAWARPPRISTLEVIAEGTGRPIVRNAELVGAPWKLRLYRDEALQLLCIGQPGSRSLCGPADDPVSAWTASIEDVVDELGGIYNGGGSPYSQWFAWGVFRSPVVSIQAGIAGRRVEVPSFELPHTYGDPFTVFAMACGCEWPRSFVGLDANGNVVDRQA